MFEWYQAVNTGLLSFRLCIQMLGFQYVAEVNFKALARSQAGGGFSLLVKLVVDVRLHEVLVYAPCK